MVDLDDQLAVLSALRDEGKLGAIGLSGVTVDGLRHALRPASPACRTPTASSPATTRTCWSCARPRVSPGAVLPARRRLPRPPQGHGGTGAHAAAESLGVTPSQVGLAWLLHHAPNVLLIRGTADVTHLEANTAAGTITFDPATLAALDAVESRAGELRLCLETEDEGHRLPRPRRTRGSPARRP